MGKAFALRWGAEGMNVVIGDIQEDALAATVAELEGAGVPVVGLRTDVSKLADIEALADAAEERFGKIHLVNNNAGVEGYLDGPIWEATAKDWDWTLSVNLMSVIYGIRTFVPRMLAHGEPGHVVNTCSMTSVIAATNMYGICKHAILAMTEVLAADLQRDRGERRGDRALPGDHRDEPVPRVTEPAVGADQRERRDVLLGRLAARPHARRAVQGHAAVGGGRPAGDGGAGEQAVPAHRP